MPAVLDQMNDAAYTVVGVNLLVGDAVVGNARKNREDLLNRLGDTGERVEKFLADNELHTPEFLEDYTSKARKSATESLSDLRVRLAPRTDDLVERLPERVGEVVVTSRDQVWEFLGIDAPKAAAAKASTTKASAAKATTTKKTTSRAKTTTKAKA